MEGVVLLVLGFSDPILVDRQPDRPVDLVTRPRRVALDENPGEALGADTLTGPVNVMITDDQTLIRAGLARLLAADRRLRVIGRTDAGAQTGDPLVHSAPDVVLMDLQKPTSLGVDAVRRFNPASSVVQILVLATNSGNGGRVHENGVASDLGGEITAEDIVSRILALYSGGAAVKSPNKPQVSKRELAVLGQVAAGLSNKQIGRLLGISQKTVRNHLSRIFSKLGASNRTEAVMNAMRMGLLII
jgi:two-component system, NarL family, response regulator